MLFNLPPELLAIVASKVAAGDDKGAFRRSGASLRDAVYDSTTSLACSPEAGPMLFELPLPLLLKCTGLRSLDFSNTKVSNIAPLTALTGLTRLSCEETLVADITPLAALTRLTHLNCSHTPVADTAPLAALTGLQSLDCSFTRVGDLAHLAALMSLTQ